MRMALRGPAEHTAEDATPSELRRAVFVLLVMLAVLLLLVVPLLGDLPLGRSTRTGILAWLLVALALYWLYAGMGYRPLLLIQLVLFSGAATLLMVKLILVALDVEGMSGIRELARYMIIAGTATAGTNLCGMLVALTMRRSVSG